MLNFDDELWLPVVGFESMYIVSNTGRVKSLRRNKMLAQNPSGTSAYMYVKLTVQRKLHNRSVHRLVAQAFVPNPNCKPMVNHIDGNKLNNNACNLEWVTCSENHRHAFAIGLKTKDQVKTQLGRKWGSASKYHNVSYDQSRNKWKAAIKVDGKALAQRRFNTEREAAAFVNELIDTYGLTNRPRNIIE